MEIENYIHIFDAHFRGEQSESERQYFEQRLASEEDFATAFLKYTKTIEGIQQAERERLKQELLYSKPSRRVLFRKNGLKWAIATTVILLVGWAIYFCSQSNQRIYASFQLGRANNLMGIAPSDEINDRQRFEEAMRLSAEKELDAAILQLEKIGETDVNIYFLAQYNRALILTKKDDKPGAKAILNELIQRPERHFVKEKAKAMLQALEKPCFF